MENIDFKDIIEKDQQALKETDYLSVYFDKQLLLIKDEKLRRYIASYLDSLQIKFEMERPTSSTGKYHPSWQNEYAGNGIHTKNVVKILQVMERAYPNLDWDSTYAAAILHDFSKYSEALSRYTTNTHAIVESKRFQEYCKVFKTLPKSYKKKLKLIADLIFWHDGRFSSAFADKEKIKNNYTKGLLKKMKHTENYILHTADMISSSRDLWEEII